MAADTPANSSSAAKYSPIPGSSSRDSFLFNVSPPLRTQVCRMNNLL